MFKAESRNILFLINFNGDFTQREKLRMNFRRKVPLAPSNRIISYLVGAGAGPSADELAMEPIDE